MTDKKNEYIFYTTEGSTIAPNMDFDVENCQVLGFASGKDYQEAKRNLLHTNPWIKPAGFSTDKIVCRQLA